MDNGENRSLCDLLIFMDSNFGALQRVSLINVPSTFPCHVGILFLHDFSCRNFHWCQTLRSWPTLHQHYMLPLSYFWKKTYSSSFRITVEGLVLLLPNITSVQDKMESSLTWMTRLNFSHTTTTDSLRIGWQTLLILI